MIILSKPQFEIKKIFNKNTKTKPTFPYKNSIYFNNGSEAFIAALKNINLKAYSKIALPAYICKTLPVKLRSNNYVPYFYDVKKDLSIDFESLYLFMQKHEIEVVLLVDFYGFYSQENVSISKQLKGKGYEVIIDRCHSSLSDRDIEDDLNYTDAIIFSLRKNFSSKDGGVLVGKTFECEDKIGIYIDFKFYLIKIIEKIITLIGWPNIYSKSFNKSKVFLLSGLMNFINNNKEEFNHMPNKKISNYLYNQITDQSSINEISKKRIKNYEKLLKIQNLRYLNILFNNLDNYTVPQVFIVIDETKTLSDFLNSKGIGSYKWPGDEIDEYVTMSPARFPNTIEMNDKVVCLPIHQSVKDVHILKIINYINEWDKNLLK